MSYYLSIVNEGIKIASTLGDGYTINIKWHTAYPTIRTNKIAYNIYMGTSIPDFPEDFFNTSPAFVSIDGSTNVNIPDLIPGQMYHFAVRAAEYNPSVVSFSALPDGPNGLHSYPDSLLTSDISAIDTVIPLLDASSFPGSGTVKIGSELIHYGSVSGNDLIVPGSSGQAAHLVDQGGGNFYTRAVGNVGDGYINNLTLVGSGAPTETWIIKCINDGYDGYKFEAIGSVSGNKYDGYGNATVWNSNNIVDTDGILSFSISDGLVPFHLGDSFIVKVAGNLPGVIVGRGYNGTVAQIHNIDGYDGYVYWSPFVLFYPFVSEEQNTRVYECWNRFDVDHFAYTVKDGYRQTVVDILNTNLVASDTANIGFPLYDFSGYHRTNPISVINGDCVGSYIGGTLYCADGYSGVGMQLRGLSVQDQNNARQEVLLSLTGEPCVLVQRSWTGITCDCFLSSNEMPNSRCLRCFGSGKVVGYTQYMNPRRSDRCIMVRFDPVVDTLKATDSGLESDMPATCWTLTVPTVHNRDFIQRYDMDGNPEFRYELVNVTRNRLLLGLEAAQKFSTVRIRKTDPIYQVRLTSDTHFFPSTISTSIASSAGILPHSHTIVINENITSASQINQLTSVNQGHNHMFSNGVMIDNGIGHVHVIILP